MHTLGGNEELALHGVTSHCWDRRDGPPRGQGDRNQRGGPPEELSTHTLLRLEAKLKPGTISGHYGGAGDSRPPPWRKPAPPTDARRGAMQNSKDGAAKAWTNLGWQF